MESSGGLNGGFEVDTDARSGRGGLLRYAVSPVALAASAHDDQIARAGADGGARTAVARADQKAARRSETEDRDDAVVASAGGPVAVPTGAVAVIAVEVNPQSVVGDRVMNTERVRNRAQKFGRVTNVGILGGEPRF